MYPVMGIISAAEIRLKWSRHSTCKVHSIRLETLTDNIGTAGCSLLTGQQHSFRISRTTDRVFTIPRSGSMASADRRPLNDTPVTARIVAQHDNRLGAVYSSLHAFWTARHTALGGAANWRDAYSVILFNQGLSHPVNHDFASGPETLLDQVIRSGASGGTNYTAAIRATQVCVEQHWSTERCVRPRPFRTRLTHQHVQITRSNFPFRRTVQHPGQYNARPLSPCSCSRVTLV